MSGPEPDRNAHPELNPTDGHMTRFANATGGEEIQPANAIGQKQQKPTKEPADVDGNRWDTLDGEKRRSSESGIGGFSETSAEERQSNVLLTAGRSQEEKTVNAAAGSNLQLVVLLTFCINVTLRL
jgi:hypothetical protein